MNARRHRRRRAQQSAANAGRRELARQPRILAEITWQGRRALYLTLAPDPAWPEPIAQAWRDRTQASTTGQCRCGGRAKGVPSRAQIMSMEHSPECMVSDARFVDAVGRWVLGRRS
jgi:hypothetical protein